MFILWHILISVVGGEVRKDPELMTDQQIISRSLFAHMQTVCSQSFIIPSCAILVPTSMHMTSLWWLLAPSFLSPWLDKSCSSHSTNCVCYVCANCLPTKYRRSEPVAQSLQRVTEFIRDLEWCQSLIISTTLPVTCNWIYLSSAKPSRCCLWASDSPFSSTYPSVPAETQCGSRPCLQSLMEVWDEFVGFRSVSEKLVELERGEPSEVAILF